MTKIYSKTDIEKHISKDSTLRKALAREDFFYFFHIYFSSNITYRTSVFQREIISLAQEKKIKKAAVLAFRGSGKSTIMSFAYPIWTMLGVQDKKHILLASQTQALCKLMLDNIRRALEDNILLIRDFGPFRSQSLKWSSNSLLIGKYGCKISAVSCGESIRGIRHNEHRPDLIICDDVEDLASVKTKEGRDKTCILQMKNTPHFTRKVPHFSVKKLLNTNHDFPLPNY